MKKTSIGGQALIEGLLMVGPEKRALASLLPDGQIHLEYLEAPRKRRVERYWLLRGMVRIWDQLRLGYGAMFRSAEIQEAAEDAGKKRTGAPGGGPLERAQIPVFEDEQLLITADPPSQTVDRKVGAGDKKAARRILELLLLGFSLALGLAVFFLLPNLLMQGLLSLLPGGSAPGGLAWSLACNFAEALIRIAIFLGYLWLCSRQKDIARVWQFHGAEHKTISCYEAGRPLTVEEVQAQSRFHPRCGTSFLFIIVLVAALLYAVLGWHGLWLNLLIRLLLIPLLAGLSYEVLRYSGRHAQCRRGRILAAPGLWLQRLTTKEPEQEQIRVAIRALEAVLPTEEGADDWDRQ